MNATFKAGWTEATFLYDGQHLLPHSSAYKHQSIPGHVNFYLQNINKTRAELDNLILARLNSVTGGSLTLDQYKTQYNSRIASFATCSACDQGFYLDTGEYAKDAQQDVLHVHHQLFAQTVNLVIF